MPNPIINRRTVANAIVSGPAGLPVTAGLLAQWEADSIVGLNDGDPVGTWTDQSGNARDATQSTTANKPLFKVNQFGTKPALFFDGANDELDFTASAVSNFSVFAVSIANVGDSYSTALMTWLPASGDRSGFMLNGQNHHITTFNSSASETHNTRAGGSLTGGAKYLLDWTYDGATLAARTNAVGQSLTNADGGYGTPGSKIGFAFAHTSAYIAAIIVYDRVLSAGEIVLVENYLNGKYPCF